MCRAFFIVTGVFGLPQLFGTVDRWQYVFVVEIAICLVTCVAMHFVDEAPSFLLATNRREEAERVVRRWMNYSLTRNSFRMHGPTVDIDPVLHRLDAELKIHADDMRVAQMWTTTKSNRRAAHLALAIATSTPFSGGAAFITYSSLIFTQLHFSQTAAVAFTVALNIVAIGGVVAMGACVINRFGRRPLLIMSLTASWVCCCLLLVFQLVAEVVFVLLSVLFSFRSTTAASPAVCSP